MNSLMETITALLVAIIASVSYMMHIAFAGIAITFWFWIALSIAVISLLLIYFISWKTLLDRVMEDYPNE